SGRILLDRPPPVGDTVRRLAVTPPDNPTMPRAALTAVLALVPLGCGSPSPVPRPVGRPVATVSATATAFDAEPFGADDARPLCPIPVTLSTVT
ncbi:hypothetical protein LMF94_23175, partial [Salmonella enterica subsp. enterica serovar Muenster]|uniref:hypothetical protein n=1 Tax=Salmonella enterica TaxID=28901 RepID=UPI001E382BFD